MTTRAEELAAEVAQIADQVPYRTERLILQQRIQATLERYGQEVREAAAKVVDAQATCGCNGKHGYCMTDDPPKAYAESIREMPLP